MPKMPAETTPRYLFNIWSEGFAATGQSGGATLLLRVRANSWEEACETLFRMPAFAQYMKKRNGAYFYWGCRLFDNEADARKSFG